MTHKKNINMYLKMLRYWDSGKETVSRNSWNYNLKWKHKNIHYHIIYFIKETNSFWFKTLWSYTNEINLIVTII